MITTKYKLSKTEPGNLNFVFADEAILRSFSDYYYITVPAIMSYAVNLICEMFEEGAVKIYAQIYLQARLSEVSRQ